VSYGTDAFCLVACFEKFNQNRLLVSAAILLPVQCGAGAIAAPDRKPTHASYDNLPTETPMPKEINPLSVLAPRIQEYQPTSTEAPSNDITTPAATETIIPTQIVNPSTPTETATSPIAIRIQVSISILTCLHEDLQRAYAMGKLRLV